MAADSGTIEYEFLQHGAEKVIKAAERINTATDEGRQKFLDLEKAARKASKAGGELGEVAQKIVKGLEKIDGSGVRDLSSEWAELTKEIANANQKAQDFNKAQVLGIEGPTQPKLDKSTLDTYVAARKAANTDIVRDHEQMLTRLGSDSYQNATTIFNQEESIRKKDAQSFSRHIQNRMQAEQDAADNQIKETQRAASAAEAANRRLESDMIRQRYAAYDISSTYAILGAALSAVGVYAVAVASQFETSFTAVERTMNDLGDTKGIESIRQDLIGLSSQIPVTFDQLSQIATIGNQMNIASENMKGFTRVMAQFASITGMSVDSVAQAFGRIQNLSGIPESQFENLASAIVEVGLESQATEEQILSVMREITSMTTRFGYSIDQTVGLAGALASLGVAPENARSALTQFNKALTNALASGGSEMQAFANITGKTSEELNKLVRSGEGASVFVDFLQGMSNSPDVVATQQALDALGISSIRASELVGRLAGDTSLLTDQMRIAEDAFSSGTSLQERYALTVDDLSSQFMIFVNNLNALTETISGGLVPGLAGLLSMVNGVISGFREFLVENPFAAKMLAIGGTVVFVTGALFVLKSMAYLARGSMLAFALMQQSATTAGIAQAGSLRMLTASLLGVSSAARGGATAMNIFRAAVIRIPILGAIAFAIGEVVGAVANLGDVSIEGSSGVGVLGGALGRIPKPMYAAVDSADDLTQSLAGPGGGGGGGVAKAAEEATEKIRTLMDYASDLSGVFNRSIELRFSSQAAMDNITLKWIELNEEVAEYQRQIRSLTADRDLKAYWLSIAEAYDDQLRAGQLREELAKVDDDLAKANAGASRELEGNSRSAIENRQEMQALVDLYDDYLVALAKSGASQQFIQDEATRLNLEFNAQAVAIGYSIGQIGEYSRALSDFGLIVATIPRNVTVGLDFNGDPAALAIAEFTAKMEEDLAAAGANGANALNDAFGGGLAIDDLLGNATDDANVAAEDGANKLGLNYASKFSKRVQDDVTAQMDYFFKDAKWGLLGGIAGELTGAGMHGTFLRSTQAMYDEVWNSWVRLLNNISQSGAQIGAIGRAIQSGSIKPYANGGYTGPGHWQSPAGIVHRGEYVIPKKHVDQRTGTPNMSYVASIANGKSAPRGVGYAGGGMVGGAQPVRVVGGSLDLGARTMHGLDGLGSAGIALGDRMVSEIASSGNRANAMTGSA